MDWRLYDTIRFRRQIQSPCFGTSFSSEWQVLNSGLSAKTCLQIVSYHLVAFWYHIRIRLDYI